jgi:hypothetical protein
MIRNSTAAAKETDQVNYFSRTGVENSRFANQVPKPSGLEKRELDGINRIDTIMKVIAFNSSR